MPTNEFVSIIPIRPYEYRSNKFERFIGQKIFPRSKFAIRSIKISLEKKRRKEEAREKGRRTRRRVEESWRERREVGCWRRYGGRRGWRRDALAPSNAETLRWCWLHVPTHLKSPGVDPSPPHISTTYSNLAWPQSHLEIPSLTCVHVHFLHLAFPSAYLFVRVSPVELRKWNSTDKAE